MATVRLAPVLRSSVGGSKQVSAEGSNLSEVLADLYKRFPALKDQIQPEGDLSRFVNVYINDQDARFLQGLETSVGPSDTIQLLPAPGRADIRQAGGGKPFWQHQGSHRQKDDRGSRGKRQAHTRLYPPGADQWQYRYCAGDDCSREGLPFHGGNA